LKLVLPIAILFLCQAAFVSAQHLSSFRRVELSLRDTTQLDSVSIAFGSVKVFNKKGSLLSPGCIYTDYINARIVCCDSLIGQTVIVEYRRMPLLMNRPYFEKQRQQYLSKAEIGNMAPDIFIYRSDDVNFFNSNELSRKGSISRGVSFGNNQDAIVNSHLNLQLSGKLSDDLEITAAISDNNIPIQPDGNTQQLQEFDKVFITVTGNNFSLTAGDFEEKKPVGYFLNYNKKAQGAKVSVFNIGAENRMKLSSSVTGSVTKGKYRRQAIDAIEGIQGPYKLTGGSGEMYIIVLAGTEKLYIDGMLLIRGMDNDYIIDYNTGEITFTAKQPISKDKRIIAEFEYSERNYTRFLITSNHTLHTNQGNFWFNMYSEQDNKNQAYDISLSQHDKWLLNQAGDDLNAAYSLNIDSVGFSTGEIRYAITDTLVGGLIYDSVFVYSTNPETAVYRLGFSYTGANKGNYIKSISSANGRVFQWVAPIDGVAQGDYDPVVLLVSPKKKQAFSLGGQYKIGKRTNIFAETAFSVNDLNTYSKKDSYDNNGMATKFGISSALFENQSHRLTVGADYYFVHRYFSEIEHFRETEFTRDWNLSSALQTSHEHMAGANIDYRYKNLSFARYKFTMMERPGVYSGLRNQAAAQWHLKSWKLSGEAGYLSSSDSVLYSRFLRHKAGVSKNFTFATVGIGEEQEVNIWKFKQSDSIAGNSYSWFSYNAFISTPDTARQGFRLSYRNRSDQLPVAGFMQESTRSHDLDLNLKLIHKNNQNLNITGNYRILSVKNSEITIVQPEDNLTGRFEYAFRLLNGSISSSSFYEIGSGLERKTEFAYLEVAPGQGIYMWTDYNSNGIQELDEFEVAFYKDQANFIRYYTTTNDYIKAYSNQFHQMLQFRPSLHWRQPKGIGKFLTRFSNQLAYKISSKNTSSDFAEYANPFAENISDSSLVSLNNYLRNELSFNKSNPRFGIDYVILNNRGKMLLVNGFDSRSQFRQEIIMRFSITQMFQFSNQFSLGDRQYESDFFASKNYHISFIENTFSFSYQPNMQQRLQTSYKYKDKTNQGGVEHLLSHDIGVEYRFSSIKKGSLSANINYILNNFNGNTSGPVAYEMLQGLLPGNNITWQLMFQHQLVNGLQINLSYSGRAAGDSKTVHTGGVQIRAFF